MRKFQVYILFAFTIIFISCEEVVNIPLENGETRLVIDASIEWIKGTDGSEQVIKITRTTPFYEEQIDAVPNAEVRIVSEDGTEYIFDYDQAGNYISSSFNPEIGKSYELEVIVEDEIYTATETFQSVVEIDFIEQLDNGGFSGEDIEIKAFYTDPAETEDYYLFEFTNEDVTLEFYEDEFTNGNQIFGYYSTEDIKSGDEIEIQIQGISRSYYEFLFILRSQIGTNQGGPFETMPATVKGNIINRTNPDNYPFGYFRLSEVDSTTYIVE